MVLDPADGAVVERIQELTDGEGVEAAIRATRPGGRISNIGYHGENPAPLPIPLEPFGMGMSDKKILTSLCPGGSERLSRLFRLMRSGRVDPTPMTTHEFGFDDVERAFGLMETKAANIIKPLITFTS